MMSLLKRKIGGEKPSPRTRLKSVVQAGAYADGRIDMVIEAVLPGATVARRLPYTYDRRRPDGVTAQIEEWLKRNRTFKIGTMVAPPVTVQEVKDEAARRIRAIIPRWKIERAVSGGKPIATADQKAAEAIREASNRLERQSPIPADYADDRHWK